MKICTKLFAGCFAAVFMLGSAWGDEWDRDGAVNLATSSGAKTVTSENMFSGGGLLFNGTRDRWLGYRPVPTAGYYPSETVTFTEKRILVNAYRVLRGSKNNQDLNQGRQAENWELYGSNDGGATGWTLLHAQTEKVIWYDENKVQLIDHVDCEFENTVPYSSYKFRVTAPTRPGVSTTTYRMMAAIDDVRLYCLERTDTLTIEHNGYELGSPTPAYGAVSGLKENDTVTLNMPETRVVDAATSRRYELTGFTIKYSDGTIVHEGTKAELPYAYTHGTRAATVVWNWSDPLADFAATRCVDLTVPENADDNEITDAKGDGSAMTYINGGAREKFGPQFLFDDVTVVNDESRWVPVATAPYYAQYIFKQDGEEVRRIVTGLGLLACSDTTRARYLRGFDLQGSNDGAAWATLLSVSGSANLVSNTWAFANTAAYSRYRFVVTQAAQTTLEMFNLEFYNYRTNDVLEILGSPAYGKPSPDYGVVSGLSKGDARTLTAPSGEVAVNDDERAVCTGYTLVIEGEEPVVGTGTTYEYTHGDKGAALVWKFSSSYRHRVAVKGEGHVDCASEFFKPVGEAVTITAIAESEDAPFLQWQGDVPAGQENSPTLTFTVDGPRSLTAVFAAPTHVSVGGDDANDGSSWDKAVKTFTRGWELCGGAGKLYLGEGEFAVTAGTVSVTKQLLIEGKGPDKTTLIADGDGTLIKVNHALAIVTGIRAKGATLASGNGAGMVLNAGTVTNCCIDSCTASGNGGGVWMEGSGVLVDSTITNCSAKASAGGVYVFSGAFQRNLVTGCSSKDTVGGAYFRPAMTVADCAFQDNVASGKGGAIGCDTYDILFTNCLFEANKADTSGVVDTCPSAVTFYDCLFTNNVATARCAIGLHFRGRMVRSQFVGNTGTGKQDYGGVLGMDSEDKNAGRLENCIVANNVGGQSVVRMEGGSMLLNCTIVSNSFASMGAVNATNSWVRNTIIAGNVSGKDAVVSNWTYLVTADRAVYSCVPGLDAEDVGAGTIVDDPRFVDAAKGDYTLSNGSPCIDTGLNDYVNVGDLDLKGDARIYHWGGPVRFDNVDMGCYESPYTCRTGTQLLIR